MYSSSVVALALQELIPSMIRTVTVQKMTAFTLSRQHNQRAPSNHFVDQGLVLPASQLPNPSMNLNGMRGVAERR
jgi:hypothetical protein